MFSKRNQHRRLEHLLLSGVTCFSFMTSYTCPANGDEAANWITDIEPQAAKPAAGESGNDYTTYKEEPPKTLQASKPRAIAQKLPTAPAVQISPAPKPQAMLVPANKPSAAGTQATPLLKGQVTFVVPSGTPLKLKLATVPMPEMKMDMRDEEGNLRPAQLGEIITAKITEDIYVDNNKVIPEGTIFQGRVENIAPPRHVSRPGHLVLSFDKFTTPDGRTFAFRAEANNFQPSTIKTKAKGAGIIAAHTAGGAALGALVAYRIFGPSQTVAMHGYNIAGGAALGALGGLGYALWKRGPNAVLEPGDEFKMSIDTDLLVPAASQPTVKKAPVNLPGLEIEVLSTKLVKDGMGFGGHQLRVEALIDNNTKHKLRSIDLFLEDDLGNRHPVSPDIDEETEELFYISPYSYTRMKFSFQVEFPKLKNKLLWFDHETQTLLYQQKL